MIQGDASIVRRRIVLHFPGFEPLNAQAHRARYARAAAQSARVWDLSFDVGPLVDGAHVPFFDVTGALPGATGTGATGMAGTESRVHIFDHHRLVALLAEKPFHRRLLAGYASAARVVRQGGLSGYFRHAWRFGLFFVFPFLLVALAVLASLGVALAPLVLGFPAWNLVWSVPAAAALFRYGLMPPAERLHTLHLFADWELAVAMASLDRPDVDRWLETAIASARAVLVEARDTGCDEVLVTSHSMGSTVAAHVIGALLEREPALMRGHRITFVTLGGAILQCALLRPATRLRARVGLLARAPGLDWLEVQCLTDSIHFYKAQVVAASGHPDAPPARIVTIRLKHILTAERYKRIKLDFLRVHRQYVLGPDRRASFDFTLMTAGPLPAFDFATFSQATLPPIPAVESPAS
ncbi:hypothetical protein ASG39_07390 [Rhizobium sp. Leaf371]|uniref:hypothetical protein n=1 Tax=Rhizobium sp. Leaf371 TaxID=1736355 RepID=UPI00071265DD|nr:hypothetical protein [Rhizobium sp. Leaf371]KQS65088.1 hypothetical protein ASG39_07390 [Rhizobium sp. Leaf371]